MLEKACQRAMVGSDTSYTNLPYFPPGGRSDGWKRDYRGEENMNGWGGAGGLLGCENCFLLVMGGIDE